MMFLKFFVSGVWKVPAAQKKQPKQRAARREEEVQRLKKLSTQQRVDKEMFFSSKKVVTVPFGLSWEKLEKPTSKFETF